MPRGRKLLNAPIPPTVGGVGLDIGKFRCSLCKLVKDYYAFYRKPGSYTGYQSQCKECANRASRERAYRKRTERSPAQRAGDKQALKGKN